MVPLGERGEELAANFLRAEGFRIVITNFKVPVGRNRKGVAVTGEIDIIALEGDTLCFIEVKTRRSDEFTAITTAVDKQKMRQITRTARVYRRLFDLKPERIRYDVVTVLMPKFAEPTVELHRAFWNEAELRKQRWSGDIM